MRLQIKRFKLEDYVRMFNGGALTNVVNRRIGSKLHRVRQMIFIVILMTTHLTICYQLYTIKQDNRGSCRY